MGRKSLFSQAFSYIFISLLLVVVLLSSVFFFSIRRSVAAWNVNRGQRLENLILPLLTQIYREHGRLEEVLIHHELSPFLNSNVFAYMFDENQEPIYIYSQGGRVPLYDQAEIAESLSRLDNRDRPLTAIVATGEVIGYLAADTLGFSHDVANRRFLQSLFSFIGWGGALAMIVALGAAYIFSKIFSRQAQAMVDGLQKLTEGNRQVDFPFSNAEEMSAIAASARRLQQQLQQEEQMRRQWADDVAHDLRTPVSALKVQLEGLSEGVFNPTQTRMQALYREVDRIDSLVQDLRELNRVESPEMKLDRRKTNLPQFFTQFKNSVIAGKSMRDVLIVDCEEKTCWVDRHYLNRGFNNVLQNAVAHGKKDGKIHISVYHRGNYTVFDVANEGWIDPQYATQVFNRLYRGSSSRNEPGSGLGLSITRAIFRAHGGDAIIEQINGKTHVVLTVQDLADGESRQSDSQSRE